ncbi:alpha/beta hydrolase [Nocardiopsis baichengensis]|uniref:alpha/beta hydrolase n=1 Tax=Nocardiopsis baichengensis TaxID=280240 RepID=UPI00034B9931|nr:alpha/beta hydrolase [Nocardiopsis baichengensis]
MAVDPELQEYLGTLTEVVFDDALDVPAERARERAEALEAPRLADLHSVEDRRVPGPEGAPEVPVRIYRPTARQDLPAVLYLHGGGFVVGGLDTHDNAVRLLAEQAGALVVSVDYRMAPEHRYPAALEDCFAAYRWLRANAAALGADPGRIAVAGDSAGGFLSLCTAFIAAERGVPGPVHLGLVYPGTGAALGEGFAAASGTSGGDADDSGGMSADELGWYMATFLGGFPVSELPHYVPPARARDLSVLPPVFVLTAEHDPLKEDGAAFAERLEEAGVPVERWDAPGMVHSFLRWMHAVPAARASAQPFYDAMKRALAVPQA